MAQASWLSEPTSREAVARCRALRRPRRRGRRAAMSILRDGQRHIADGADRQPRPAEGPRRPPSASAAAPPDEGRRSARATGTPLLIELDRRSDGDASCLVWLAEQAYRLGQVNWRAFNAHLQPVHAHLRRTSRPSSTRSSTRSPQAACSSDRRRCDHAVSAACECRQRDVLGTPGTRPRWRTPGRVPERGDCQRCEISSKTVLLGPTRASCARADCLE